MKALFTTLYKEKEAKAIIVFFLLYTIFWLILQYLGVENSNGFYDIFTTTYGLMAVLGGISGLVIANHWGGMRSIMGKAILAFSWGILAQEVGQLIYTYYIYALHIEVPYPSWGDIGYFGSIPLYIMGVLYLAQASGVTLSLKSFKNKLQAIFFPVLLLLVSYFVFLRGYTFDWTSPLTIFLDFGYPLGQTIYISIALLTFILSKGLLGGRMKNRILFLLFALVLQYVSDFMFLYQAANQQWSVSGLNDYMYFVSYAVMALSIIQFKTVYNELRASQE